MQAEHAMKNVDSISFMFLTFKQELLIGNHSFNWRISIVLLISQDKFFILKFKLELGMTKKVIIGTEKNVQKYNSLNGLHVDWATLLKYDNLYHRTFCYYAMKTCISVLKMRGAKTVNAYGQSTFFLVYCPFPTENQKFQIVYS